MRALSLALLCAVAPGSESTPDRLHDGPDPVAHWPCTRATLENGTLKARLGRNAVAHGEPTIERTATGDFVRLDGNDQAFLIGRDRKQLGGLLPKRNLTLSAWVAIDTPQRWGGILGYVQDNGDAEAGFVLGYDEERFTFGLAGQGAVEAGDSDGSMTYLRGGTRYQLGKVYFVVATYDGAEMRIYVNGKLDGSSTAQTGPIYYPQSAPYAIGAYWDENERQCLHGRLRDVMAFDLCAKPAWVQHEFEHHAARAKAPAKRHWPETLEYVVQPYLQYVTETSITVMCETTRPARSVVRYGETADTMTNSVASKNTKPSTMHEIALTGLRAQTGYFYRIESIDDRGQTLDSGVLTFQSAVLDSTPFAFAIISDTQDNPTVAAKIGEHAWAQRPNFVLIPGDLVGTGGNKKDWTDEFFPSVGKMFGRVAFFPVLGNHEQNARFYYDYVSLPKPEYYYSFRYGNAEFFMIDSNKQVGKNSEQYRWLDAALAKSKTTWKFVSFHHPCYSSDENDYGDMWKGKSTHGDTRIRELVPLFDQHGVDIVWNGHIHSYERTWPMRKGRVVEGSPSEGGGTVYMITGGGGGGLETPGPIRPWFQNNVRHGHHYCMVAINGKTLEFKAFDLENRLFDTVTIEKRGR